MALFRDVAALILFIAALCLHIIAEFLPKIYAYVCAGVNLALHIILFWRLMIIKSPTEETVLIYVLSLLVFTICGYIAYRIRERGGDDGV